MIRVFALILIAAAVVLAPSPFVRAQFGPSPYLQITLDKPYYYPGDAGRLMIDIRDTLSTNIQIYNISIVFPWRAYINGHWEGNQTISVNKAIRNGSWLPTVTVSFNIPSDSRYFGPSFFSGTGQGMVTVWASGVGPGGSTGTFGQQFFVGTAYLALYLQWHDIYLILIVMTVLVGVMAGAVLFYVYSNFKRKQRSLVTPSP